MQVLETGKKWLEDRGYSSLSDIKVRTEEENLKEIKDLNDQIQWLDFWRYSRMDKSNCI